MELERVRDVVNGRALFVTGATGFVGKVLVEKLLRDFDARRIFLLVRPRTGSSAKERVWKEIVNSEVMDGLKRKFGGGSVGKKRLEALCEATLVPVSGDVIQPRLELSDESMDELKREKVEIIIHCAASVNFDDPLDTAIELNTEGALRVLDLAKELNCKALVHVSTAYVNANKLDGQVLKEKIYPLKFDPAAAVQKSRERRLSRKKPALGIDRLQAKIQGSFPNTYTLTKAMAEVLLHRNQCHIPMAIVRPSIVGASWREPCPGWVDVVSAASAVFMGVCLGVLTMLPGNPRGVAAIVPVDFVVNHMLLACAEVFEQESKLHISHSCTSAWNPVRWRVVSKSVVGAYQKRTPPVKLTPGPVKFRMLQNRQQFDLEWALRYDLPALAVSQFANLTQNKGTLQQASRLKLLQERSKYLVDLFRPFTSTEFLFDTHVARQWSAHFPCLAGRQGSLYVDALDIAWPRYFENYVYGLNRFILREDLVPVSESAVSHTDLSLTLGRLLDWDPDHHSISFPGVMSDISWAYTSSRKPGYTRSGVLGRLMGLTGWREGLAHEAKHVPRQTVRGAPRMKVLVMKTKQVREAVRAHGKEKSITRQQAAKVAEGYFDEIASTLEDSPPRVFGWALRKVWRNLYDGIRVHEEGVERLRDLASTGRHPIVLVPTHRSYVDFLMLSFIFFALNLPVPYIAATTDFLKMKGVSNLLRASGAFFLRRQGVVHKDPLYAAVFTQYLQRLLVDRQIVEYYLEGTRSRSGKTLAPKDGLTRMCLEPILDGRLEDVIFVPISIDYEKPIEATLYSKEMLGISKAPETTENLLKSAMVLRNKFGHVSVQFAEPVSGRAVLQRLAVEKSLRLDTSNTAIFAQHMGYVLVDAMQSAAVCMPIHLVSTLLLMYRHGITLEQLVQSVDWLREEVLLRGGHIACAEGEHRFDMVKRALKLLGPVVHERSSPRVIEVAVKNSPKDYLNMIILGYYRNKIVHLFEKEALWACALYAHWAHTHISSFGGANPRQETSMNPPTNKSSAGITVYSSNNRVNRPWDLSAVKSARTLGQGGISDLLEDLEDQQKQQQQQQQQQQRTQDNREPDGSRGADRESMSGMLDAVKQDVTFLDELFRLEFTSLSRLEDPGRAIQVAFARLQTRGIFETVESPRGTKLAVTASIEAERLFGLLCSIAWPLVDGYFVASSALIALLPDAQVKLDTLLQRMSLLAENFYHDRVIYHYESCSSGTLQNALYTFADWGVVTIQDRVLPKTIGKPAQTETFVSLAPPYTARGKLQELIDRLDFLRGPLLARPRGSFTATSVADFPMLARI